MKLKPNLLHAYWILKALNEARESVDAANKLPQRERALWYSTALRDMYALEKKVEALTYLFEVDKETLEKYIQEYFEEIGFV